MKQLYLLVFACLLQLQSFAAVTTSTGTDPEIRPIMKSVTPEMAQMAIDEFLALTPAKYKEMTGKRLGLKKTLELKAAQKILKKKLKKEPEISKGLYVLMAIFAFGWLAMGLMDDWSGSDWVTNLILTVLCWLPGVIHALIKMKKYY